MFDEVRRPSRRSRRTFACCWRRCLAAEAKRSPAEKCHRVGVARRPVAGSGNKHYLAENGNVICVSNFSDAMLDLPIKSTQVNAALMFEAFTERIPPVGAAAR